MAKRIRKHKRLAIVAVVILVLAVGGYFVFRPKDTGIRYVTESAAKGTITVNVTSSGTLSPTTVQNAGFRTSGRITEINVKVGDKVAAGQQLAKLDTTQLQNQLTQSQAALDQANNNLQKVYLTRSYTTYDVQNAKAAISSAQAKVNNDQDNLNNATLTSTIAGTVININNKAGDSVSGNGSNGTYTTSSQSGIVMTIIDLTSLQADLSITETDIRSVALNQTVQLSFDALSGKTYVGKVSNIDLLPTINSNVVSYGVKVKIDKVDADLKPGMTASASILVANKGNVITVANSAIKTVSGQKTVQILKDGSPLSVNVTTGLVGDTATEITDGVNEGDEVITNTITGTSTTRTTTTNQSGSFNFGGGGNRVLTRF